MASLLHPWATLVSLHAMCQQGKRFPGFACWGVSMPSVFAPGVHGHLSSGKWCGGTADYLPGYHYSVLASCHPWCYPTVDWCGEPAALGLHCTAAASFVGPSTG